LNLRPSGYEPDELPGCSTPRHQVSDRFGPEASCALISGYEPDEVRPKSNRLSIDCRPNGLLHPAPSVNPFGIYRDYAIGKRWRTVPEQIAEQFVSCKGRTGYFRWAILGIRFVLLVPLNDERPLLGRPFGFGRGP
jgi:hypothetical protein